MTNEKQIDEVEQHDLLFSKPLQFFHSKPFSDNFVEVREDIVYSIPQDPYSDIYQFARPGNNVGLIKTSDAKISGTFSITTAAGALCSANSNIAIPPIALRTLWKTKELKINETLVTPADNHGSYASYLNFLMRSVPSAYADSRAINVAYFDTERQFNHLVNNPGMRTRRDFLTNTVQVIVDDIDCACFSEGGGEVFIPSAFKIDLRLTRENYPRLMMGADHADIAIATSKVKIEDLKIKFPIFKPKQQITGALNKGFIEHNEEAKWYSTSYRCVTQPIAGGRETHQQNDIFNGSVPVRLLFFFVAQANYNGGFDSNMFEFPWENYKFVDVTVNNASVGKVENSQEAYNQLRNILNRKHSEMPFTYEQFITGYGILAFDLTTTRDTHLTSLPVRTRGTVGAHIDFTQATRQGVLFFVGEFRNEIKAGLKTPARLLFDY